MLAVAEWAAAVLRARVGRVDAGGWTHGDGGRGGWEKQEGGARRRDRPQGGGGLEEATGTSDLKRAVTYFAAREGDRARPRRISIMVLVSTW